MKTRIGVIVRQRHIDRGRCRSPKSCPIALAMKEQLGTDKVKVYADGVFVDEQKYWIPFRARTLLCVSRPKLGINQQTVKEDPMSPNVSRCLCAFMVLALVPAVWAQDQSSKDGNNGHGLRISSATFNNNGTIPYSMVWNQCSAYPGGLDQSPQLSWTGARGNTRSFIVVMYDVTASFTHWGMYNIASTTTSLPQNAGVVGSTYGTQIYNDFGDPSYDGPCPPTTMTPLSHQYVVTVYALKIVLPTIPTHGDFVPFPEALYQAMIAAARNGDILDSASITGYFPGN